tara:strand:- start:6787 stop:7095 length:309 start_codon:yes stop_codon:yes gene_type:complete
MAKLLKFGDTICGVSGKTLSTYSDCTAVNWYSTKSKKVVTTFLSLDNENPEVKALTDTIGDAISALFELHNQSPTVQAYKAGNTAEVTPAPKVDVMAGSEPS